MKRLTRLDIQGLSGLTLLALGLRVYHLTHFELWVDEAATWHFARLAASGHLLEQLALEPTPPLYFILTGVFMRLFGESDFVLRLPSVLAGVAAVPAVFALAAFGLPRFLGRRVGYLAAGLMAIHPLHVFYSQEARAYPLLLLESVLLWLALRRCLRPDGEATGRQQAWSWVLFASVLLAACTTHFFGLFLGATAGVLILLWSPTPQVRLRGIGACLLVGLILTPYLAFTLPRLENSAVAGWVGVIYERFPEEKRFGRTLEMGLFGASYAPFLREISRPKTPDALRWASLLCQAGLLTLVWLRARRLGQASAFGFLLMAWLLPLLIPWTLNHVRPFFHPGRHDFYVIGTLCVLLGAGLDELVLRLRAARGAVAGLALALLVLAAGQRLVGLYGQVATDHNTRTGQWIAERANPGDRVIALGLRRLITEHYTDLYDTDLSPGQSKDIVFESFPGSTDLHPGWADSNALLEDQQALQREGRERISALARTLPQGATLFVLPRSYSRTATSVSADWWVDRHLLENLTAAGWRPVRDLQNRDLRIAAFRPPEGDS